MSLLFRNAWGRLVVLAAIAAVLGACGAGPGAKAQPDPVKIPDVPRLDIGKTHNVSLVNKFSGEGLTYTATSSDEAVATVKVDNDDDILTVTAVGAGEATITVTAADSQDRTASQTFKVTVKPTTSEPEPGAPTVRAGAQTSVDFEQGGSSTARVTLSRVFEGEDLTYSAPESDDPDVAIASISNGILIIRAGDPGTATITVTATNAKGEAEHAITVTVPDPEETGQPGEGDQTPQPSATSCKYPPAVRVTIDRGRTKPCTIPKGHTLNPDSTGVSVRKDLSDKTGMVWLVTANIKGKHDITVHDGAGKPVTGKITVVVPNSLPFRNPTSDRAPIPLTSGDNHVIETLSVATPDLHSYFTDPDTGDTSPFIYRIVDQPKWVLIETKDGFLVTNRTPPDDESKIKSTATTLYMEVLNELKEDEDFTVSLVASDGSAESEVPVVLTFEADTGGLLPRPITTYTSQQTKDSLGPPLKVGPRRGVDHKLTFEAADGLLGFSFTHGVAQSHVKGKYLPSHTVSIDPEDRYIKVGTVYTKFEGSAPEASSPIEKPTVEWAVGDEFLVLESEGSVVAEWGTALTDVSFKLKDTGTSGAIKITYYVVRRAHTPTTAIPAPSAADRATASPVERFSVNVITCTSFPETTKDCPEAYD